MRRLFSFFLIVPGSLRISSKVGAIRSCIIYPDKLLLNADKLLDNVDKLIKFI